MSQPLPYKLLHSLLRHKRTVMILFVIVALLLTAAWLLAKDAATRYEDQLSTIIYDRNDVALSIAENSRNHYVLPVTELPEDFSLLLLQKEDRFFRYHFGINPISSLRALVNFIRSGRSGGSSTLTQQLAKNLLGTETDRTLKNKLIEAAYTLSIECFTSKNDILTMYANTVYLGNQLQGFDTASLAYFNHPLSETTLGERISLLATLSYPSTRNPWEEENTVYAEALSQHLTPDASFLPPRTTNHYSFQKDTAFELHTAGIHCVESCQTTIDDTLTTAIRNIMDRHIQAEWNRNLRNAAVVVIDTHDSALLAMVGSRDPGSEMNGNQINLALTPRPIGSTIKPFIYSKGFSMGLRPYTLVEDREYKYPIATGFPLYPKNYDGQYRGEVTLHEALSNSLNVPSVKVLEYIGLEEFYNFLDENLSFSPLQSYDSYQYGIALGGLEMDLTTLTHYFTLFPNKGTLRPLRVFTNHEENFNLPPQSNITTETKVIEEQYIELVHAIISDRFTGVNQFGLASNLNITGSEYGVKTGTSRDYHDSWVVGYTPDLVVGVWAGNSENEALDQVSGQSGAGAIWHEVMEHLLNTEYIRHKTFSHTDLERIPIGISDEWGLRGDVVDEHQNLLLGNELILSLHEGDTFELTPNTTIPLRARTEVTWTINGEFHEVAQETNFTPLKLGNYEIAAYNEAENRREIITVHITSQEQR
jgi:membrane peptidoglycan carboxypeptidase